MFWIGYVFIKDTTIERRKSECSFKYVEYPMHHVCLSIPLIKSVFSRRMKGIAFPYLRTLSTIEKQRRHGYCPEFPIINLRELNRKQISNL